MKRAALLVILLVTLGACARATTPPTTPAEPEVPAQTTPVQKEPVSSVPPPPPPSPTKTEPPEMRLEFQVAGSKDGPWTPYRPGVHVGGTQVWLKIQANLPLPPDAVDRFTKQVIFTPGIQGERLSDRAVLLTNGKTAIWVSPDVVLPEGSQSPFIMAFAGRPPEIREWDPSTGESKTLATLYALPGLHTRTLLEADRQALTYSALLQDQAVEVNLKSGESRRVATPAWPWTRPVRVPYRLDLKPGQSLRPDTPYSARVMAGGGEVGQPVLELPDLYPIVPYNPCLPFPSYYAFAPDGERLAVATMEPPETIALLLVDLRTGKSDLPLKRPAAEGWRANVSWSPDGRWLVFHDALVEVATGRVATTEVARVSYWRPDSALLLSAGEEIFRGWGPLRLIAPDLGRVLLEAEGRFIAWTVEGRLLYFDWPNGASIPIGPRDCH